MQYILSDNSASLELALLNLLLFMYTNNGSTVVRECVLRTYTAQYTMMALSHFKIAPEILNIYINSFLAPLYIFVYALMKRSGFFLGQYTNKYEVEIRYFK